MTQYFYVDESGDAGMKRQASSSSHFVIAMVQLPERTPIRPLVDLRKSLNLNSGFGFKYHKTTSAQKDRSFHDVQAIRFRVRAMALDKARIGLNLRTMSPRELMTELIIRLTLRASELDIANEILIIDGASQAYCRHLRVQITEVCTHQKRIRPFKKIIGANSRNEDGLQMADMFAGAIRLHAKGISSEHFQYIAPRVADLWNLP
jgi:hypothetical protein